MHSLLQHRGEGGEPQEVSEVVLHRQLQSVDNKLVQGVLLHSHSLLELRCGLRETRRYLSWRQQLADGEEGVAQPHRYLELHLLHFFFRPCSFVIVVAEYVGVL